MEKTLERDRRKHVTGKVVSDKMAKTIIVQVERLVKHPRYEKYVRKFTKVYAHDEKREAKTGDLVEVMATRPLSRRKRWALVRVVARAARREEPRLDPEKVLEGLRSVGGGKNP